MGVIRSRRESLGLSQRELGRRCGVQEVTARQWEIGIRLPQMLHLKYLACALECDLGELAKDMLAEYRGPRGRHKARTGHNPRSQAATATHAARHSGSRPSALRRRGAKKRDS